MTLMDVQAPATRSEVGTWPDLSQASRRVELTPAALKSVMRLVDRWHLTVPQVTGLLGGMSASAWHAWRSKPPVELSMDQLTRISLLLGIYTTLHVLHPGVLADEWVTRPNSNPIFAGRTPVQAMIDGGIPVLIEVRALLDGRRGGL